MNLRQRFGLLLFMMSMSGMFHSGRDFEIGNVVVFTIAVIGFAVGALVFLKDWEES